MDSGVQGLWDVPPNPEETRFERVPDVSCWSGRIWDSEPGFRGLLDAKGCRIEALIEVQGSGLRV